MPLLNSKTQSLRDNSKSGFSLIELMVVIAIIAILSAVGLSIYTSAQSKARDAKRRSDVDAMAKVYELHYNTSTGKYSALDPTNFSDGVIPSDPKNVEYNSSLLESDTKYVVCAHLENADGNSINAQGAPKTNPNEKLEYYCRKNLQ